MDHFANARLLIKRANSHIGEFKAIEDSFSALEPYTKFREKDRRTGKTLFKARIDREIPPDLGAITFDIVGALRSALDHAVYDSVRILTGKPAPENTKFPFGKTKKDASGNIGRKNPSVPPELVSFLIKRFKPYQRGNRPLYALNQIRNQKIHRTLSPMAIVHQSIGFGNGFIGNLFIDHLQPKWDSRKKELTYMTASSVQNVSAQISITTQIVIDQPTFFRGKAAVPIFDNLVRIAEDVILAIESETGNLLLKRKKKRTS